MHQRLNICSYSWQAGYFVLVLLCRLLHKHSFHFFFNLCRSLFCPYIISPQVKKNPQRVKQFEFSCSSQTVEANTDALTAYHSRRPDVYRTLRGFRFNDNSNELFISSQLTYKYIHTYFRSLRYYRKVNQQLEMLFIHHYTSSGKINQAKYCKC